MLISLFFFSLGNIMCAIAPNMWFLIAARAIAGIGGGGLTSVGSTIMSDLVPISYRGIFQGYGNIMFGLGSGLGAPIGGIINVHLGWRWAFYLQIPLLVLAGIMIWWKVRYTVHSPATSGTASPTTPPRVETIGQKLRRVDWLGSFTLAIFMGLALLALTLVTSSADPELAYRWDDKLIIGMFVASAFFFCVFLHVELFVASEPILPVELLTQRTPVAVAINNFVISILSFGVVRILSSYPHPLALSANVQMYSVPLYYMAVRLMLSSDAGIHLIPNSILGSMGSLAVGFIVRSTGRYYMLTIFCGLFSILSAILLATWDLHTSEFWLWTSFGPMAFSMGSVTTLTIVGLIADIGREHVAVATSCAYPLPPFPPSCPDNADPSVVHVPHDRPGPRRLALRSPHPSRAPARAREPHHRPRIAGHHLQDPAVVQLHPRPPARPPGGRHRVVPEGAACRVRVRHHPRHRRRALVHGHPRDRHERCFAEAAIRGGRG